MTTKEFRTLICCLLSVVSLVFAAEGIPDTKPPTWNLVSIAAIFALLAIAWRPE